MPGDAWRELLHRKTEIPGLSYELVPNRKKLTHGAVVTTNFFGMRDEEPISRDTPDVLRVAALGDSFTFGFGVPGDSTYPKDLEKLLRQEPRCQARSCEVLNFGVGGYCSRDEALVLRYKALEWKPRLVIVGYALNDPETDAIQPLHSYFDTVYWWQYFHLGRLFMERLNGWVVNRWGGGDYTRYLHAEGHPKWESVLAAFADMRQATEPTNTPVIVAIFPVPPPRLWSKYEYRDIHAQVARAATDAGLEALDLLAPFERYEPATLRVEPNDNHPSILAHQIAAEQILARLKSDHPDLLR